MEFEVAKEFQPGKRLQVLVCQRSAFSVLERITLRSSLRVITKDRRSGNTSTICAETISEHRCVELKDDVD